MLPSPLCADPMLPLVATLAIFKAMLDSPSVVQKDKAQVIETGDYLAKRLPTVAMLVGKSTPTVAALLMLSHVAREVGGEGRAKPSYLTSPAD